MRHTVRIERKASTRDGAGGASTAQWEEVTERRAAMRRVSGTEQFSSSQRRATVSTEFRLRFDQETRLIEPKMRLTLLGATSRYYDIISAVDPDGRMREVVIVAEERVGSTS